MYSGGKQQETRGWRNCSSPPPQTQFADEFSLLKGFPLLKRKETQHHLLLFVEVCSFKERTSQHPSFVLNIPSLSVPASIGLRTTLICREVSVCWRSRLEGASLPVAGALEKTTGDAETRDVNDPGKRPISLATHVSRPLSQACSSQATCSSWPRYNPGALISSTTFAPPPHPESSALPL